MSKIEQKASIRLSGNQRADLLKQLNGNMTRKSFLEYELDDELQKQNVIE